MRICSSFSRHPSSKGISSTSNLQTELRVYMFTCMTLQQRLQLSRGSELQCRAYQVVQIPNPPQQRFPALTPSDWLLRWQSIRTLEMA